MLQSYVSGLHIYTYTWLPYRPSPISPTHAPARLRCIPCPVSPRKVDQKNPKTSSIPILSELQGASAWVTMAPGSDRLVYSLWEPHRILFCARSCSMQMPPRYRFLIVSHLTFNSCMTLRSISMATAWLQAQIQNILDYLSQMGVIITKGSGNAGAFRNEASRHYPPSLPGPGPLGTL